jgi:hypothetical protein
MHLRIGLVGCTKSKLPHAAPARELYSTSALFRGRRDQVERTCDRWFILSAKHGLIEPDAILEPYDETLKNASRDERRRWSRTVMEQIQRRVGEVRGVTFECHAGEDYLGWGLREGLESRGAEVRSPTRGLPLGRQLAFYRST